MNINVLPTLEAYNRWESKRHPLASEVAGVGSWEWDLGQKRLWCDEQCRELVGLLTEDTFSFAGVLERVHPEDRSRAEEAITSALRPNSLGSFEIELRMGTGETDSLRWIYGKGQALLNEKGQAYHFFGTVQDVSRWMGARQPSEPNLLHWHRLVESSATATAVYQGREMRIIAVNEAMIDIWGKDASVRGKTFAEAIPEVEDQPFLTLLQGVYDTGITHQTPEGSARLIVDGRLQEFWFTYAYAPLKNEAGQVYGIIHTATDITAQVHARWALEVQQQQFRAMMEGSLLLKSLLDGKGTITFQNQRYGEYTGLSLEENQQKSWQHLFFPGQYDSLRASLIEGFKSQRSFMREGKLRRYDGEYCWHEMEFVPLFEGNKQLSGWVFRATDIHERKMLQHELEYLVQERTEELEASLEELQALNEDLAASNEEIQATSDELISSSKLLEEANLVLQEQSEALAATNEELQATGEELSEYNQQLSLSNDRLQRFAYVASHDLQEPLRKIQTFGSLLSQRYGQELGEQGLSLLTRMSKAGQQMSTLIHDLLIYSRMNAQSDRFQLVSLQEVITQVLDTLELRIEQTGAAIEVESLPAIMGDEVQLRQLFQNLLSNAIKFVKPGQHPQIQIHSQIRQRHELPTHVKPISKANRFYQISVIDQGIGFEEQFLDRIFEVFQRLHDKREYQGTGVGLAICQRVMENHAGAITAQSEPGHGASFQVYFPGSCEEN